MTGRPDWWRDDLPRKECDDCGVMFQPHAEWQTLCRPCYCACKDGARANAAKVADAALRANADVFRLRAQLRDAHNVLAEVREQLPRLLLVAHPDKHGNSDASNRATAFLLELRQRLGVSDGRR